MHILGLTTLSDVIGGAGVLTEGETWFGLFTLLVYAALSSLAVYFVCRVYFADIPQDRPLSGSLVPAAVLTTLIYYQNSMLPGLSILMIAILAFIHYRSVIKDMTDVAFVFWTVLTGLLIGAGLTWPVLLANVLIAAGTLGWLRFRTGRQGYLLLIRYKLEAAEAVFERLKPMKGDIHSQHEQEGMVDLAIEVKLCNISLDQVDQIAGTEGVESAVMVSRDKLERNKRTR